MKIYEIITEVKKRINSKRWEFFCTTITDQCPALPDDQPKKRRSVTVYDNAESLDQVKDFLSSHDLIVMAPLGISPREKSFDMVELLKSAVTPPIFTMNGKTKVVAHVNIFE